MSPPGLHLRKRPKCHWLKQAPSEFLQVRNAEGIQSIWASSSSSYSRRRLRQSPALRRYRYADLGLDELRIECSALADSARTPIRDRKQPDAEERERHRKQRWIFIGEQ